MNLPDIQITIGSLSRPLSVTDILKTNQDSQKYGLILSESDALELIASRNRSLMEHGRVELGIGVLKKLLAAFCSSPYVNQPDYAATINELVDIFYYMKNVTDDKISDDELIALMQSLFNKSCRGSLELLKDREMLLIAQLLSQAESKLNQTPKGQDKI